MKSEICPVCKGTGWACGQESPTEGCHGCGGKGSIRGKGWVEVHEEPSYIYPLPMTDYTYTLDPSWDSLTIDPSCGTITDENVVYWH